MNCVRKTRNAKRRRRQQVNKLRRQTEEKIQIPRAINAKKAAQLVYFYILTISPDCIYKSKFRCGLPF